MCFTLSLVRGARLPSCSASSSKVQLVLRARVGLAPITSCRPPPIVPSFHWSDNHKRQHDALVSLAEYEPRTRRQSIPRPNGTCVAPQEECRAYNGQGKARKELLEELFAAITPVNTLRMKLPSSSLHHSALLTTHLRSCSPTLSIESNGSHRSSYSLEDTPVAGIAVCRMNATNPSSFSFPTPYTKSCSTKYVELRILQSHHIFVGVGPLFSWLFSLI